jgi:hypothetical protein
VDVAQEKLEYLDEKADFNKCDCKLSAAGIFLLYDNNNARMIPLDMGWIIQRCPTTSQ